MAELPMWIHSETANALLEEIKGDSYKNDSSLLWAMREKGYIVREINGRQCVKTKDVYHFAENCYGKRNTKPGRGIVIGKNKYQTPVGVPAEAENDGRSYVMPSYSPAPWDWAASAGRR